MFVGGQTRHVVGYMKDFLFAPEQAGTPVSALSGGERGRLTLARALAKPSNLLVLDEPTNDLDLETLDLLEEMIADYPGTVLLVSHDRDFLDRTVSAVMVAEGGGRWNDYAGGYHDMVAQRGEGVTAKAVAKSEAKAPRERAEALGAARRRPASRSRTSMRSKRCPRASRRSKPRSRSSSKTIADPGLYARDRAAFDKASAALAQGAGGSCARRKTNGCGWRNCASRWRRDESRPLVRAKVGTHFFSQVRDARFRGHERMRNLTPLP